MIKKTTYFNTNGLRERNRRHKPCWCARLYEMICLQETHWDEGCMSDVEREWMGEIEKVRMCVNDCDGRVVGIP